MNKLDVFCLISVARTHSFSLSAKELMISQQAVSRHIQSLEQEIGVPLFLRNYHEIYLTRAGERMLRCLAQRETMVRTFIRTSRQRKNVLRVGWSQWVGCPEPLRQRLREFQASHDEVVVSVAEYPDQDLRSAVENDSPDLLITTNYTREQLALTNSAVPLLEEPLYLLEKRHEPAHDRNLLPFFLHVAAPGGERDPEGAVNRVRAEYARMGLRAREVQVLENPWTVSLNVLLKDAVAFALGHPHLLRNERFSLQHLDRTVTVTLCRLARPDDPDVKALEAHLRGEVTEG